MPYSCSGQQDSRTKGFHVFGKLTGRKSGLVFFYYRESKDKYVRDSCALKDGYFSFTGIVSEPTTADFALKDKDNDGNRFGGPNFSTFFIEPGKLIITAAENNISHSEMRGSNSQLELERVKRKKDSIIVRELDPLNEVYKKNNAQYLTAQKDSSRQGDLSIIQGRFDSISLIKEQIFLKLTDADIEYVIHHPESYISSYLLANNIRYVSFDSLKLLYNTLSPDIQKSYYGLEVATEIQKTQEIIADTAVKSFIRRDVKGGLIDLDEERKDKYILLDFWASWCIPCRQQSPHLKLLYNKYKKSGFEIIGVADDNKTPDAWRKAILQDGLEIWKQILINPDTTINRNETSASIGDIYNVASYPTQVLINKNGNILERYGDKGVSFESLDKRLMSIFGY